MDAHRTAAGAPGAVVGVWVPGHGTWVRAQGVGDVGTGAPITTADTVRIASITKTFTATVVLQLVDEGKLRLDDVLEPHVPGLPNGARITVRQLLGMTSGVFNILEDPAFLAAYEADPLLPFTPQEAIAIARTHPAAFAPGERFHYSETNYLLLGLIVERLTGRSAGEAIEQRIVRYSPGPNGGPLRDLTRTNPGVSWTAGAMVSNLDDLRVWVKALATGALLSPSTQQERLRMTAIPGGEPVDARYGLGIFSLVGFLGHNGAIAGYSTVAVYLPEEDATIVVLVNTSTLEGGATDAILFDVAGLLFPNRFPPRP